MKLRRLMSVSVISLALLGSSVACADDEETTNCQRTEEYIGNPDCGHYINNNEWIWNDPINDDVDKPKKKKKKFKPGRRR